jgi:hypothetical protein
MSTEGIDTASEINALAEELSYWTVVWSQRGDASKPQARERAAGGTAVDTIDAMLAKLHRLRSGLVGELRQHDDAFMAALDAKYGPVAPNG